ncbi:MAG: SAM-dependent methyltransferase, partial [Gemmatimonadetes bacterium]|nr:SAM-dependent methyltransferase [Gemmatimonadota bacterium]
MTGIRDDDDREWYATVFLARVMFLCFLQAKGFLDGDRHYLQRRFELVQRPHGQDRRGRDRGDTFFQSFLLPLFHEGLAQPPIERRLSGELAAAMGTVPCLGRGLFTPHELERRHPAIDIPDEAVQRLLDFLDRLRITPDILGYVLEQHVNQKQTGTYYTKEDITDYICRNTIVPVLFDAVAEHPAAVSAPGAEIWRKLRNEPDRYIFPALRYGVFDDQGDVVPLPAGVAAGIDNASRREAWNDPAGGLFALPGESWREHVARRRRCLEVRETLSRGDVQTTRDLVTYNLDSLQFALDAIASCDDPDVLRTCYEALAGRAPAQTAGSCEPLRVLDPTCGSGAFLFGALRVLTPLYA